MSKRLRETVAQGLTDVFEGADLLGSVIRQDRARSGRTGEPGPVSKARTEKAPGYDTMTSKNVVKQYDNMTSLHTDIQTHKQPDTQADKQLDKEADMQADNEASQLIHRPGLSAPKGPRTSRESILRRRRQEAHDHSRSPTATVTLRIPQGLIHWIDEYVHRSWPTRVKKQELVTEALKLLYAMRGRPGEPVLETDLLEKGPTESSRDDGEDP